MPECPLSGVKRTCLFALHMSAFDQSGHFRFRDNGLRARAKMPGNGRSTLLCEQAHSALIDPAR
jgi:hypothetical protein